MNILIITDHFPPAFAPRMGYLVRNLKSMGHFVAVVSETKHRNTNSFSFLTGYADVVYEVHEQNDGHSRVIMNTVLGMLSTMRMMWTTVDSLYYSQSRQAILDNSIDCILCSTSSFYPLLVADRVSRENNIPLFLDFRDIYEQDEVFFPRRGLGGIMRHFQKRIRNRIIARAQAVISVSSWHSSFLSQYNKNSVVILNGFDERIFVPKEKKHHLRKRIVYTGTVSTPKGDLSARSPEILFQAILMLPDEYKGNVEVVFYTDETSRQAVMNLSSYKNLSDCIQIKDWVPADQVPDILADSDALLVLTGNNNLGVMTTKFFEYLACCRPILKLHNPSDQMSQILTDTQSGCCFDTVEGVLGWLQRLLTDNLDYSPNIDKIASYSRKSQALEFESLLKQVL